MHRRTDTKTSVRAEGHRVPREVGNAGRVDQEVAFAHARFDLEVADFYLLENRNVLHADHDVLIHEARFGVINSGDSDRTFVT